MLPPPAAPAEPALDFLSPSFDALRALRQPGLAPPDALRAPLDNLSRCVPLLPPEMPEAAANLPARHRRTAESVAAAERAKAGRQAAAAATAARERATTIVQRAAQAAVKRSLRQELEGSSEPPAGPLSLLAAAMGSRRRVRVTTRHARGVRGVAVGFLAAFDRHCNLLLKDVDEAFTVLATAQHLREAAAAASSADAADPPRRARPRQLHRTRHMAQILLRGDQVVLVALEPA